MAADDWLRRVRPLTHARAGGGRYERDPAVDAEIASLLDTQPLALIQRAKVRDRQSKDFLRDETLVYFIRAYHAVGEQSVVILLTNALLERCAKWITRRLGALGLRRHHVNDAYLEVVRIVIGAVTDLASDRGDFYQVRFARALKLKVLTAYDRQLREVEREAQHVEFPRAAESGDEGPDDGPGRSTFRPEMADPGRADDELLDAEERAERRGILEPMLSAIRNPRHREAFVLQRLEGWQITAENPREPCLTRHFGKSPKTIYNWIKQAEADIASAGFEAWLEEGQ
jgi:hypothetical protein